MEQSDKLVPTVGKERYIVVVGILGVLLILAYLLKGYYRVPHTFSHYPFPFGLLAILSIAFYFLGTSAKRVLIGIIAGLSILGALGAFFSVTGSGLIFTDDHPAFLFRLIQLKENFPHIPFYNPLWNAGVEAREFFASGVLNVFILFSPLLYAFDIESIYTPLVAGLLFVLVPGFSFFASRIIGGSRTASALSALLVLTCSIFWYRWSLVYGTMGFVLAAGLVPLNLALISLIFKRSDLKLYQVFLIACSLTLMFLWSPSALLFAPFVILVLGSLRSLLKNRNAWVLLVLLIAFNLPWMSIFVTVSRVGDFVAVSSDPNNPDPEVTNEKPTYDPSKFKMLDPALSNKSLPEALKAKIKIHFLPTNPLILVFGVLGLVCLGQGAIRRVWILGALSATVLGVAGPFVRPQLELERMIVVLALILAVPAAGIIERFISLKSARLNILQSVLTALLCLSPLWIVRVAGNLTAERFTVAGPEVQGLTNAIVDHAQGGRTLFVGFTLHELSGGHVAPLAAWTNQPLIASSYQHDKWKYVDSVPEEYRARKDEGMNEYYNLMNVSLVATHERFWIRWYNSRKDQFEKVWQGGRFHLYKRKDFASQYFQEGSGEILEQSGSRVALKLDAEGAIIRFTYLPFLQALPCTVSPAKISDSLTFVRLSECPPGQRIILNAVGIGDRIL